MPHRGGTMRGSLRIRLAGALVAGACALVAAPAAAQGSYSQYDESPASALALGDAQAAAGFFARADDVSPRSPQPQAGMGAVSVANGDPQGALSYFTRAQQLGASIASFACERGLAYDLMGDQRQAQADYRIALGGPDADEARSRLALSLAISGNRSGALQ